MESFLIGLLLVDDRLLAFERIGATTAVGIGKVDVVRCKIPANTGLTMELWWLVMMLDVLVLP